MEFEIYCAYHSHIDVHIYGDQLNRPIFVKLGTAGTPTEVPRCLDLRGFETFCPLGRQYAETEMLLNLYWAKRANLWEPPDFIGFIHYDMSWRGVRGYSETISDYLDRLELNQRSAIAFQPFDGEYILRQPGIEWIMELSRLEYAHASGILLNRSALRKARLAMCNAFLVHRNVFIRLCSVLDRVYMGNTLAQMNVNGRIAGGVLERIAALHLFSENLDVLEFPIEHQFVASVTGVTAGVPDSRDSLGKR